MRYDNRNVEGQRLGGPEDRESNQTRIARSAVIILAANQGQKPVSGIFLDRSEGWGVVKKQ